MTTPPSCGPSSGAGTHAADTRDAQARNIAEVLDFTGPPSLAAPRYFVAPFVAGPACAPAQLESAEEWGGLKDKAIADGWSLPT